jgi:predicted N-acetyltransferase YhbS
LIASRTAQVVIEPSSAAPSSVLDTVAGWLHHEWYAAEGSTQSALLERLALPGQGRQLPRSWVARRGDAAVGTAGLALQADPRNGLPLVCLIDLYVHPSMRRQGVGELLARHAADEVRHWQVPELGLFTRGAERYFARLAWCDQGPTAVRCGGTWQEGRFMTLLL